MVAGKPIRETMTLQITVCPCHVAALACPGLPLPSPSPRPWAYHSTLEGWAWSCKHLLCRPPRLPRCCRCCPSLANPGGSWARFLPPNIYGVTAVVIVDPARPESVTSLPSFHHIDPTLHHLYTTLGYCWILSLSLLDTAHGV